MKKIIFILMLFTVSCYKNSVKLEEKKEGNNSFENAQIIRYDGVNGLLKEDKDYYYFIPEKTPQVIDIELSSPTNKTIAITLFNDKKEMMKITKEPSTLEENTKTGFLEIMKSIYIKENTNETKYYISVESDSSTPIPYKLILKKKEYKETDEKEPNDQISKSQVIELNSENRLYKIDGYYSQTFNPSIKSGDLKNMEIDAYKITNNSYNPYLISIELSGVPAVDASIRLYDSNGNWIMIKDINMEGDGENIDKLLFLPYMSYYLAVTSTNAVYNIPYQLNIIAKPYDKYIEHEPNNKPENAQNIEFSATYSGAIDHSLDNDYFTFSLPINSDIKLSYFMIDSQAINISISNEAMGKIATMSQTEEEYTNYLKRGKYYLIFERDKTKEAWKKGTSKPRNYQFSVAALNKNIPIENIYNETYVTNSFENDIEKNFSSSDESVSNE